MIQITQILLFSGMPHLERSKITVSERHLFKKKFAMKVLGLCISYVKMYFQEHLRSDFLFMAQITQILLFLRIQLLQRSKITVWERHLFKKKICYGSFRYMSTLHKRVFLGALVKYVFLYGSNNSDSVVAENDGFVDIKNHSLRETSFKKKIINESFGFVSTLRKKIFSGASVKCFSCYGSNNSDSVVFMNAAFGEIKDHRLSTIDFLKIF